MQMASFLRSSALTAAEGIEKSLDTELFPETASSTPASSWRPYTIASYR